MYLVRSPDRFGGSFQGSHDWSPAKRSSASPGSFDHGTYEVSSNVQVVYGASGGTWATH